MMRLSRLILYNYMQIIIYINGESFDSSTNNWHDTKVNSETDAVAYVVFIGTKNLKNSINKN